MHLIIPMSGQGTRYQAAGYIQPKPLIPVNGIPMIERLLEKMPLQWESHFVLAENHKGTGLEETLKKLRPKAQLYFLGVHRSGPSFALRAFLKNIPETDPIFVSYCDYGMIWDPIEFQNFVFQTNCDACLVSYRGFHAHYLSSQNYAFSRIEGNRVREVREKGNFTDNRENEFASSGGYYFRTRKLLEDAIDFQIKNGLEISGELYTSLTVQALLQKNAKADVRVFEIPGFFQWGTPQDLQNFEYWEKTFQALDKQQSISDSLMTDQVLMPMAGYGSRFKGLTELPKPLIVMQGQCMFQKALSSIPAAQKTVLVTTREVSQKIISREGLDVVVLDHVPEGQALTTELGLKAMNEHQSIIVSACDHGIALNEERWQRFTKMTSCDAAIFVIKGFPGVARKPHSYSYVETEGPGDLAVFKRVSVKAPLTGRPQDENLLVGTFWFRNKAILQMGIDQLRAKDIRTNGEIYLDAVFDEIKQMGLEVRIHQLDGYVNWGDPDSLKEALYWEEIFGGHELQPRSSFPGVRF